MRLSFFDYELERHGGRRSMLFLREMHKLIPWKEIERLLIERGIYKPNKEKQGRRSIPASTLIGALFLQSLYGLSHPMTEELIHDRIPFRKFLNITEEETIADETTICKFRNALIGEGLLEVIFNLVKERMKERGMILSKGTLVDATLIHAPEPKIKKDGNGNVLKEASDPDASYTSKKGIKYHGYQIHIGTDRAGIIKDIKTTTAKVHDFKVTDDLTKDETKAIFADSAYMSKERKRILRDKGIFAGIIERRVRGQKELRPKQRIHNKIFYKIRGIVCHLHS
mgnify:CR=1 FL=1